MRNVRRGGRAAVAGEYLRGALWVLPGEAAALALSAGSLLSGVRVPPDARLLTATAVPPPPAGPHPAREDGGRA
ncbi:hypothetical protein [Streptomyces sp. NPDC003393]